MRRATSMPTLAVEDEGTVMDASLTSLAMQPWEIIGDVRAGSDESAMTAASGFDSESEGARRATADESAARTSSERGSEKSEMRPTVLVVDDCALNRRLVTSVLTSTFIEVRVETAQDGREGIKRFEELTREGDLALIVMDYNMPWCDGVTAAKYIRALEERQMRLAMEKECAPREKVPIVMYTTELHVILPALVDGVIDDRLPKVCTRDLFTRVVLRHLAPIHTKYVLPEWRGLDARCLRFSCNDAFNIEFDPRGVAFAELRRLAPPAGGVKRKRMRDRLGSFGLRSLSSKNLKGSDDVIVLLDRTANSDASGQGIVNRLTRSFRMFFTSTPTMSAKMKELRRAALEKKFHAEFGAKGDSSEHVRLTRTFAQQPSVPRYSY